MKYSSLTDSQVGGRWKIQLYFLMTPYISGKVDQEPMQSISTSFPGHHTGKEHKNQDDIK